MTRKNIRITPDFKRVIPRFFNSGNERSLQIINKVVDMPEEVVCNVLGGVLREFSCRYKDINIVFENHYSRISHLVPPGMTVTRERQHLLGAYFTMEYSLEAAALFNPSVVEAPDQGGMKPGEKRVIVSFRATGESHISSIEFREGVLDKDCNIHLDPPARFLTEGKLTNEKRNDKEHFAQQLTQLRLPEDLHVGILHQLTDEFTYSEIDIVLRSLLRAVKDPSDQQNMKQHVLELVDANYELHFPDHTGLSERVIFPVTYTEKNGIEDARFVKFIEEEGSCTYYATYTAYDGSFILPKLIRTCDFKHFEVSPLYGKGAVNKNLALFPKKIKGKYAMLSRIDGVNNYIMFSDDLYEWQEPILLQKPKYPWEFVQIGNAGSPLLTEKGWLIISHGVGPMRKYCLGATLFDLEDPTKELGRLQYPLLMPKEDERDGYVPNVVYSCGAMIHEGQVFIPYAVSDYASSFASVPLDKLLKALLKDSQQ
ncbi:glycoside hydrolase family 130 protein [Chitinophaga sp. S165]|uniref:glycoside hydrolase family 130 protein n=1 Tax=Chitinophaga sp. S165 TaxID=2135462 RepID=UPI000D71AF18|nr:glycoside hydrolase family 130 protein [Chitinophaga sp. S165]